MTDATGLQLEHAEFEEQRSPACATCTTALNDQYYEVNGEMVCGGCRDQIGTGEDHGTRASRVARAVAAGIAAALGGSLLYWAILAVTGYEFGLIAVVVGIAVGKAVNWGARGKGGWRYQTIAMALTYLAMVGAYVPLMIAEMSKQPAAQTASSDGAVQAGVAPETATPQSAATGDEPTLLGALLALIMIVAIACAIPFLSGIQNILGILILGFGLYEAWKLNRRIPLVVTGPHVIVSTQPALQ
jgi:hypothetical protein